MNAVRDLGWAAAIVLLLGSFWTAVEPRPDPELHVGALEERVLALMRRYETSTVMPLNVPVVQVADWSGPGVASASCDLWRIRVRPGAVEGLSEAALDDLLAHELAHLLVCAEQGRRTAHDSEWWRVYRQLQVG